MSESEDHEVLGVSAKAPPVDGPEALTELVGLLDLQQTGSDSFTGDSCSRTLPFVFGGQVAAQALSAAYRTVPRPARVHSMHSYFMSAGDPQRPLEFRVERQRDGNSFWVRQVLVTQDGSRIFTALMSFSVDRPGLEHGKEPGRAFDLDPEDLQTREAWLDAHRDDIPDWWSGPMAMDLRFVEEPPHVVGTRIPRPVQHIWMRASALLEGDSRLHECVFTFASDLTLLDPVVLAHGRSWYSGELRGASLDHSIWFHRGFCVDQWLLYEQSSPAAYGGRGLATGNVFSREGRLVASVAQEGLIQLLR